MIDVVKWTSRHMPTCPAYVICWGTTNHKHVQSTPSKRCIQTTTTCWELSTITDETEGVATTTSKKKGHRSTTITSDYDMEITVKHVKRQWLLLSWVRGLIFYLVLVSVCFHIWFFSVYLFSCFGRFISDHVTFLLVFCFFVFFLLGGGVGVLEGLGGGGARMGASHQQTLSLFYLFVLGFCFVFVCYPLFETPVAFMFCFVFLGVCLSLLLIWINFGGPS